MGNALKNFLFMHAIDYIMRVVLLKDFRKIEKNYFYLCTRASVLQIVLYKSETNACNFMLIKLEGYDMFEWLGI